MKILEGIRTVAAEEKLVLTIGMFDGVHKGHQSIIEKLNALAKQINGHSALLTFTPHPRQVLQPDSDFRLLSTLPEKISLLQQYGLDYLIIHPFTYDFSRTSGLDFVRNELVNKLNIHTLVIGYDHHFGRNRSGDFSQLEEFSEVYDFKVLQLPAIMEAEKPISSTKVRNAIEEGNIEYATEALNHPYTLLGRVVHGDKIGRTLGFPTINLRINSSEKLLPKDGVYGVRLMVKNAEYNGLMNIGIRPTLEGKNRRIEIYITDFEGNLYNEEIAVDVLCRIRSEKKFSSLDDLKQQIKEDVNIFKHYPLFKK